MSDSTRNDTPPLYVAVVDDDENFGRSLGRLLRAAGMQPVTYISGEAFLADVKHPQFDCLVFDVRLGGMSGIELGRRLRAEGRYAPLHLHRRLTTPRGTAGAEEAGCAAFFCKTDRGADVLDVIRRVARHHTT